MPDFLRGFNLPFIGYGHDFGRNAWGYDGLATSGWRVRRSGDNQGFQRLQRIRQGECGGPAMRVEFALDPAGTSRRGGELFVDVETYSPIPCPGPATPRTLNLDGATARLRIWLPPGSAGAEAAPNGVQLFFSTKAGSGPASFYTPWRNLQKDWEGRSVELTALVSNTAPGSIPAGFDAARISELGIRFRLNDRAAGGVAGFLEVESLSLDAPAPVVFSFEESLAGKELAAACEACSLEAPLVRVFVLCDGRAGVRFGENGEALGLDEEFFEDFDTLLEAATRRRVLLMPVLLDFHWCHKAQVIGGVQLGGRSHALKDPDLRRSLLSNAIEPILCRYGDHPAIHSWDIINEPEWVTSGVGPLHRPSSEADPVPVETMRTFVRECAEAIHGHTTHLATLGSAKPSWVRTWRHTGLDLYQFHWYESFAAEDPFPWGDCSQMGLDKPCLVGEVPTAKTSISPEDFLAAARAGGYAGLLFWSSRARDSTSDLASVRARRAPAVT
jgi:hypothetical protein